MAMIVPVPDYDFFFEKNLMSGKNVWESPPPPPPPPFQAWREINCLARASVAGHFGQYAPPPP